MGCAVSRKVNIERRNNRHGSLNSQGTQSKYGPYGNNLSRRKESLGSASGRQWAVLLDTAEVISSQWSGDEEVTSTGKNQVL